MRRRIESILLVICMVMVFTAQANRPDDKGQKHAPAARSAPIAYNNQPRRQAQNHPQVPNHKEVPQQAVRRTSMTVQSHSSESARQSWTGPRVYAIPAPAAVPNNRLFHRQHHKNWQPRYNFYDNQYHFYPYVNIASTVELDGGYTVIGPDGQDYYYDQGTFYLQQGAQYVAIPPPVGIVVSPLATGARQINVNGQIFYRYKGVFYVQAAQGYQVIAPVQPVPADL